jgi:pimeloyl-ACP methyl ester carboxylesterase
MNLLAKRLAIFFILALSAASLCAQSKQSAPATAKPTIVLVHGAFAESSSWNGVASRLQARGYHVVAAANPLRGVGSDAAHVEAVLQSISGPVVLVGYS